MPDSNVRWLDTSAHHSHIYFYIGNRGINISAVSVTETFM